MTKQFPNADTRVAQDNAGHQEDLLIEQAIAVLEHRIFKRGPCLDNPQEVRRYLRLKLAGESQEVFSVCFLDSRLQVMAYEPLFHGTIDAVSVYPRRILQRALELNSAAIIVAHNHPSGNTEPSQNDKNITVLLKDWLPRMDIRLVDHFIIGEGEPYSFAEAGLI
jgi:DNA repair protein RadC